MSETRSSCETGLPQTAETRQTGSRVLHWQPGFRWEGVPVVPYKSLGDSWCGVARTVLAGEQEEQTAFQVRYFEIAPGGYSSLEHHRHEHVVMVLRGRGEVRLGGEVHQLSFGDVVYVAPQEVHQFRNACEEPLGFLCIVDARRDTPVPVD
jgi:ribulose-bisphosphate carboxylase large chain